MKKKKKEEKKGFHTPHDGHRGSWTRTGTIEELVREFKTLYPSMLRRVSDRNGCKAGSDDK